MGPLLEQLFYTMYYGEGKNNPKLERLYYEMEGKNDENETEKSSEKPCCGGCEVAEVSSKCNSEQEKREVAACAEEGERDGGRDNGGDDEVSPYKEEKLHDIREIQTETLIKGIVWTLLSDAWEQRFRPDTKFEINCYIPSDMFQIVAEVSVKVTEYEKVSTYKEIVSMNRGGRSGFSVVSDVKASLKEMLETIKRRHLLNDVFVGGLEAHK